MALISTLDIAGAGLPSRAGSVTVPTLVTFELDYAKALVAKGSALAANDIIEVINIPAGTVVLGAGAFVKVAGDSTTLTVGVGTGVDDNEWVDAFDGKSTAGTYAADLDAVPAWNTYGTADTIDVKLQTLTGTLTVGKLVVYALLMNVAERGQKAGIAALKS
jgi:hypothetical protein